MCDSSGFVRDDPDNDGGLGRIVWSVTDENGGIVEQGELINGTFRMSNMYCRDVHFLEYREDGTVKVGLGIW